LAFCHGKARKSKLLSIDEQLVRCHARNAGSPIVVTTCGGPERGTRGAYSDARRCVMRPDAVTTTDERQHVHLRTTCGRELTVGRLALGDAGHPKGRVFVDLGKAPGCGQGWAGLTVPEARRFARAILSQAEAAEQECEENPEGC
jgi:hypothetical protein